MSNVRLISGHNNTPTNLESLSPPLLKDFKQAESVLTGWFDYVTRELAGDRSWVNIGRPHVTWTFYRLSRAEYAYLLTFSGNVTIRTLNQTLNAYHTYNGTWKPAETGGSDAHWSADSIGGFDNVMFEIYDLVQIG